MARKANESKASIGVIGALIGLLELLPQHLLFLLAPRIEAFVFQCLDGLRIARRALTRVVLAFGSLAPRQHVGRLPLRLQQLALEFLLAFVAGLIGFIALRDLVCGCTILFEFACLLRGRRVLLLLDHAQTGSVFARVELRLETIDFGFHADRARVLPAGALRWRPAPNDNSSRRRWRRNRPAMQR